MASLGGVGLRRMAPIIWLRRWRRVPMHRVLPAALASARCSFLRSAKPWRARRVCAGRGGGAWRRVGPARNGGRAAVQPIATNAPCVRLGWQRAVLRQGGRAGRGTGLGAWSRPRRPTDGRCARHRRGAGAGGYTRRARTHAHSLRQGGAQYGQAHPRPTRHDTGQQRQRNATTIAARAPRASGDSASASVIGTSLLRWCVKSLKPSRPSACCRVLLTAGCATPSVAAAPVTEPLSMIRRKLPFRAA